MGIWIAASCAALLAMTTSAYAQRMPDYSMSVEESLKPQANPTPQPGYNTAPGYPNYQQMDDNPVQQRLREMEMPQVTGSFMTGYCDPNFRPVAPVSAVVMVCLKEQREKSCAQFKSLPPDVQPVVDVAAGCAFALGNNDENLMDPDVCADSDTRRMEILKKYWQDQATASALVFLPDSVAGGDSKCITGGR